MVRMPYLFLASLCLHGFLTFLLKDNACPTRTKKLQNFQMTLVTLQTNTKENIKATENKKIVKNNISNINKVKKTKEIATVNNSENSNMAPSVIYGPSPNYPEHAKANGREGEFSVTLKVNTQGNVEQVIIETISGELVWFKTDLLKVFKTWKFAPCEKNTDFFVPVTFVLS